MAAIVAAGHRDNRPIHRDRTVKKLPSAADPEALAAWRAAAARSAPGGDVDALNWHTPDGIAVKPLYTAADLKGLPYTDTLPGFEPFLRGPQATMYAVRPWTIRQYAGFSTAEESNAFYRKALAGGGQGVSVAFDLATHRGYDSDHPRVTGDVGKAGVAIDSVEDMKILFDGIPLDKVSVSMTMNGAVLPVLAGYIVAAEEQGVAQDQLSAGPSRTTSSRSSWSATPTSTRPSRRMRIIGDIIEYTAQNMPKFNSISISRLSHAGSRREPGAGAGLHAGRRQGVREDRASPRAWTSTTSPAACSFFWAIGMNFYLEVAKMRAARLLWCRIMKDFDAEEAQEPDAAHALPDLGLVADRAGPVQQRRAHHHRGDGGGVRRHAEPAHQRASTKRSRCPPSSARASRATRSSSSRKRRTSRNVVDPWAGSYMMEKLTQDMADAAWAIIEEVEAMGGMTQGRATAAGPSSRSRRAPPRSRRASTRGKDVIVGVNKYKLDERRRDRHPRHRQRRGARRPDRAAEGDRAPSATRPRCRRRSTR